MSIISFYFVKFKPHFVRGFLIFIALMLLPVITGFTAFFLEVFAKTLGRSIIGS